MQTSEEDGLLDIVQRHLLLEPLGGQLAIGSQVPTTDTGPGRTPFIHADDSVH